LELKFFLPQPSYCWDYNLHYHDKPNSLFVHLDISLQTTWVKLPPWADDKLACKTASWIEAKTFSCCWDNSHCLCGDGWMYSKPWSLNTIIWLWLFLLSKPAMDRQEHTWDFPK
jgi:hypothetical protein